MNRQQLLDLPSHGQEQGGEDGSCQEEKGHQGDEQEGSKVGEDQIQEGNLLLWKPPDDVKGPLGLHEEPGSA